MMIDEKEGKNFKTSSDEHWARDIVIFGTLFNAVGHTVINTGDAIVTFNPTIEHVSNTFISSYRAVCGGLFLAGLALIIKYSLGDKTELDLKKQFGLILMAGALTKASEQDLSAMMLELGASAIGLISIIALCNFIPEEEDQPAPTNRNNLAQLN